MSELLSAEDLARWLKCNGKRSLRNMMTRRNIPYWHDHDGWPVTTVSAINKALGVTQDAPEPNWTALDAPAQERTPKSRTVLPRPEEPMAATQPGGRRRGGAVHRATGGSAERAA